MSDVGRVNDDAYTHFFFIRMSFIEAQIGQECKKFIYMMTSSLQNKSLRHSSELLIKRNECMLLAKVCKNQTLL